MPVSSGHSSPLAAFWRTALRGEGGAGLRAARL